MADATRPGTRRRPLWVGLLAAVALPLAATGASLALRPHLEGTLFIFYFPAVVAATWFGGLSSGLLATFLSVAMADYYIIPPLHRIIPLATADIVRLTLFAIAAFFINRFSAALASTRDAAEELAANLSERERHLNEQLEEGQVLTEELEEANHALLQANQELQLAQSRGAHLFELAARLSEAATPSAVGTVMFEEGLASVGADAGSLGILVDDAPDAPYIEMSHSQGYGPEATGNYNQVPLTRGRPLSDALLERRPVLLSSFSEWRDRYPETFPIIENLGFEAFAAVPIILGDRAVAGVTFSFREPREFDEATRAYLETMARVCAQALERARAYEAESRSRQHTATIVESIADGFVALDEECRFTYVNGRAAEMWQRPASGLLGLTLREAFPEHAGSPIMRFLESVVADPRLDSIEDYSPTLRRWIELRAYPTGDGGVVAYFQDVTARRRSQEATEFLAEASRLLTSSSNYNETLSNLAHAAVPRLGDWCAVDVLEDPTSTAWPPALGRVAVVHQEPEKISLGLQMMRALQFKSVMIVPTSPGWRLAARRSSARRSSWTTRSNRSRR